MASPQKRWHESIDPRSVEHNIALPGREDWQRISNHLRRGETYFSRWFRRPAGEKMKKIGISLQSTYKDAQVARGAPAFAQKSRRTENECEKKSTRSLQLEILLVESPVDGCG
jgi:hypothetical protein